MKCRCFFGPAKSARNIASMKPFTGSGTLSLGVGFFRFNGTGCHSAFATVFRDHPVLQSQRPSRALRVLSPVPTNPLVQPLT
ncbi:hypothetical protein GCM10011579_093710 [Streptomyces albiflavescens]|uniref:Uncharacterized protein n=1 Tax=Streptomyces albiflavescens TaxID=1623582 RepID=A0A918DAA9_9ACTN|nr:hypothetical protein GCM10011579_093710 [Streptomyces albiflavescens]